MASWYTPPPFVPVQYVPAGQKEEIRDKQIRVIHATAHEKSTGPYAGGYTNHWCLYLQTGDRQSVQIDVIPNLQQAATEVAGGSKANIVVSLLSNAMSQTAVHSQTMPVPGGLSVGHVVDLILEHGLHRYELTPEGVGCRRWISDCISALGTKGWLATDAVQAARNDIGKLWPEQTSLEIGGGKYY